MPLPISHEINAFAAPQRQRRYAVPSLIVRTADRNRVNLFHAPAASTKPFAVPTKPFSCLGEDVLKLGSDPLRMSSCPGEKAKMTELARYLVRKGSTGWMVWDRHGRAPARLERGQPAIGLTEEQAREIKDELTKESDSER